MTRLGDFLNILVTNFLTKVAQIFWQHFGLFEIIPLSSKNYLATFWAISGKIGRLFIPSSSHTASNHRCHDSVTIDDAASVCT